MDRPALPEGQGGGRRPVRAGQEHPYLGGTRLEIYRNFSGKKSADEQKFTEVSCHNPAEVLKFFFSDYRIVSDDDKKWICSLAFVEMLRTYSPDDAAKVEKFRQQNASDGFQRLYRYISSSSTRQRTSTSAPTPGICGTR